MFKIFALSLTLLYACGQESLVECDETLPKDQQKANCVEKNPDEQAVIMLNANNFTGAIEVLEAAVAADAAAGVSPSYVRNVRLAAAYAGNANCAFLDLLSSLTGSDGNEEIDCETQVVYNTGNILGEIEKISYLNKAINIIAEIPTQIMNPQDSTEPEFYVGSAKLQSSLYIPVHSNKCLKLFSFVYDDQGERAEYINEQRLAATGCQPSDLADNLLRAALDVVATLGCGDSVSQETCDQQQALIRDKASEISERSTLGESDSEISNLLVSLCQEENPDGDCPELVL